ncbi:hypothetical protein QBC44DRAFT_375078 [Cladorrhinum sp. PSN332]|nr:hypothetical protein QBC44DRAFT_375078 [Cladorrhinum sp. PSN332]
MQQAQRNGLVPNPCAVEGWNTGREAEYSERIWHPAWGMLLDMTLGMTINLGSLDLTLDHGLVHGPGRYLSDSVLYTSLRTLKIKWGNYLEAHPQFHRTAEWWDAESKRLEALISRAPRIQQLSLGSCSSDLKIWPLLPKIRELYVDLGLLSYNDVVDMAKYCRNLRSFCYTMPAFVLPANSVASCAKCILCALLPGCGGLQVFSMRICRNTSIGYLHQCQDSHSLDSDWLAVQDRLKALRELTLCVR